MVVYKLCFKEGALFGGKIFMYCTYKIQPSVLKMAVF